MKMVIFNLHNYFNIYIYSQSFRNQLYSSSSRFIDIYSYIHVQQKANTFDIIYKCIIYEYFSCKIHGLGVPRMAHIISTCLCIVMGVSGVI